MKRIRVNLKNRSYSIHIGSGILKDAGKILKAELVGRDAILITNDKVKKLHGRMLISSLKRQGISTKVFTVPDSERSKSPAVAVRLLEDIARYDTMKNIFIIAFGGGVIGDLAGFVAATYKRGIPYVQIPTTLLAQIDSSIGGKVAIDLSIGKNLVGAYYQPKLVLSDVAVLQTLSMRQLRNGLAEAVKYGVILDEKFFNFLETHMAAILSKNQKNLIAVVNECSRIKKDVVVADEFETKGLRTILNFGHTLGHAIESAGKYKLYHHGEAIALGMRMAAHISHQVLNFSHQNGQRLNNLLTSVGLPSSVKRIGWAAIYQHMLHDKKFICGKNKFVLAKQIGKVRILDGIKLNYIKSAVKAYSLAN